MDLEDRMKEYEKSSHIKFPENIPIILRLDGRAFHTLTKGINKPFDLNFIKLMNAIAIDLCDNEIMNAKMAYIQSDEISILIYKSVFSDSWFKNDIQKMVSISASRASSFAIRFDRASNQIFSSKNIIFDSRVFVLPVKEVCNYFIWRQRDWERNSIQMLAQKYYSQKQLQHKNREDMHEMIHQKGDNWNDLPTMLRRGRCIVPVKKKVYVSNKHFTGDVERNVWIADSDIPIFTKDRNYIEKYLIDDDERNKD